jgi:hypothetical protein
LQDVDLGLTIEPDVRDLDVSIAGEICNVDEVTLSSVGHEVCAMNAKGHLAATEKSVSNPGQRRRYPVKHA